MMYGYARSSNKHQSVVGQSMVIRNRYPDVKMTIERSGSHEKLEELVQKMVPGDVLVIDQIFRLSDCMDEGAEIYEALYLNGIEIEVISKGRFSTRRVKGLIEAITESGEDRETAERIVLKIVKIRVMDEIWERNSDLEQRRLFTINGIKAAKKDGKVPGRKAGSTIDTKKAKECRKQIKKKSRSFDGKMCDVELMQELGIARNTFYKYKKQVSKGHI